MNIDNLKSQMRKGMLEFSVLLLLRAGDAYSSEIIARMKDARLIVVEGTLYPLLTRLKNDGLLTYRWQESPSGPPRKYYSITPLGIDFLRKLQESWDEIAYTIGHLRNLPYMPPEMRDEVPGDANPPKESPADAAKPDEDRPDIKEAACEPTPPEYIPE